MATRKLTTTERATLMHPAAGAVREESRYLAIRWMSSISQQDKQQLLQSLGLVLVKSTNAARPVLKVNQTDGLAWVEAQSGDTVSQAVLEQLENSAAVAWVAFGMRSQSGSAAESVFAINPTRFYLKENALKRAGGLAPLASNLKVDTQRPSRLPEWVAITVDNASTAKGNTALKAAVQVRASFKTLTASSVDDVVKFENIPLLSPTCGTQRCQVPTGEFTPNDPLFTQQWGLQRIGIPRAWEITRGSPDITVAVIDEGVELGHHDLLLHPQSWNASNDIPDGGPVGDHGTACAGIIGARFDNNQGIAGVAAGVKIMAIATATWADVDIAESLYFAADNGARVISMSFGVYTDWNFWDFDLLRDALQYAYDKGLVLVAASGNEDQPLSRFPGSDARTLCVGGSNRSDERKRSGDSSSESWWGACYGADVDVVAPCLEIPTTDRFGTDGYSTDDYTLGFNGTSSATPHVAGLAALILSLNPSFSNVQVRHLIEKTCDKISPALYVYAHLPSKPSGVWNEEVGYGRINAERALLAACALIPTDNAADVAQPCSGCGGDCLQKTPTACRAPAPVPWLPHERCMYFYETRMFDQLMHSQQRLQIRVTYRHALCLQGRQQGGLLYTTTLLPGEEIRIHEYDRYRRVRSASERVSVHTSFRQVLSSLSQTRSSMDANTYTHILNDIRTHADTSVSAGGGLAGFFGAPKFSGEFGLDTETSLASGASVQTSFEQFNRFAVTASQAIEAERSLTISTFEDEEHRTATSRILKNTNHCHAVTYYVRRVNELYSASSYIEAVEWRIGKEMPWRFADDLDDDTGKEISRFLSHAPTVGEMAQGKRLLTLPTDGTLYEAELAHCSSCDPMQEAAEHIRLERERATARKACLENELLELEIQRRKSLLQAGQGSVPLELQAWSYTDAPCVFADTQNSG